MEADKYWLVTHGDEGDREYANMFYCSLYRCKTEQEAIDLFIKQNKLNINEYMIESTNYKHNHKTNESDNSDESDEDKESIYAHEIKLNTAETVN